jgi:hypothetical protein
LRCRFRQPRVSGVFSKWWGEVPLSRMCHSSECRFSKVYRSNVLPVGKSNSLFWTLNTVCPSFCHDTKSWNFTYFFNIYLPSTWLFRISHTFSAGSWVFSHIFCTNWPLTIDSWTYQNKISLCILSNTDNSILKISITMIM